MGFAVLAQTASAVSGEASGSDGPLAGPSKDTRVTAASLGGGLHPATALVSAKPVRTASRIIGRG
jgi:hypothetical protein